MAVAARLLLSSPQGGKPRNQLLNGACHIAQALSLIPHRQELLFEIELEWKRGSDAKGKVFVWSRQISREFSRIPQQVADLRKQLQCVVGVRFVWQVSAIVVVKELDATPQIRFLFVGQVDFKASRTPGEDVHAPVLVLPYNLEHTSAAPNCADLPFFSQDHSELLLGAGPFLRFQAASDHLLVALLEDVEGQQLFWE